MTTQTEAMKLALMNAAPLLYQSGHKEESAACNAALLMLLAEQPARQEPKIGCVNHDCDKCKAQQEPVAAYGYCPICLAKGVMRERRPNGNDKCINGHTYPSNEAAHSITKGNT